MLANDLKIADEVVGRIGGERQVGVAASGAPLVEKKDVVAGGIEQRAVHVLRSAARSAVQEHDRPAAFLADFLDVDPMPVADVEHAGVEGAERFGQRFHRDLVSTLSYHGQAAGSALSETGRCYRNAELEFPAPL